MSTIVATVDSLECQAAPAVAPAAAGGDQLRADLWRGACCVFDQGVVSAASFATSMLIGRGAGPEGLGLYFLAMSFVLLVRGIQEQTIAAPYTVYAPHRSGRDLRQYTGSALVHQMSLALAVMLGWLAISAGSLASNGSAWTGLALLLALATPALLLKEHLRQLALARLQLTGMLLLDLVASILQIGLLAILFARHLLTTQMAFAVLGISAAAACSVWWLIARPPMAFRRERIWCDWQHNWSFGRWALFGHLLGSSGAYLMPWFLAFMHGEAATGLLGACLTLVGLANTLVTGLSNYLSPRAALAFAADGRRGLKQVLQRAALVYSLVLAVFCLLMFLFGEELLRLAFGQRYTDSAGIVPVLALNLLVNSLGIVAGNGLWTMNCPRANSAADGCSLVVSVVSAALLVPTWGAFGAAVAMLAGTIGGTLARTIACHRRIQEESSAPVLGGVPS